MLYSKKAQILRVGLIDGNVNKNLTGWKNPRAAHIQANNVDPIKIQEEVQAIENIEDEIMFKFMRY